MTQDVGVISERYDVMVLVKQMWVLHEWAYR